MSSALHNLNAFSQVNLHRDELEEIVQEEWLFFKVENHSTVVEIVVSDIYDVLRENIVSPSTGRMFDHGQNSLILLVVDTVEVHSFRPHLVLLASTDKLGNKEFLSISTDVVQESGGLVFSKKDS